jgi:hypothetical protein
MSIKKVRKLVSLSPDRYEDIEIQDAILKYTTYLKAHTDFLIRKDVDTLKRQDFLFKDFDAWLLTEI